MEKLKCKDINNIIILLEIAEKEKRNIIISSDTITSILNYIKTLEKKEVQQ